MIQIKQPRCELMCKLDKPEASSQSCCGVIREASARILIRANRGPTRADAVIGSRHAIVASRDKVGLGGFCAGGGLVLVALASP